MRLNFNIVIVDDDFDKPDDHPRRASINNLKDDIEQYIKNKGFSPEFFRYTNLDSCLNDESLDGNKHRNRIDFYLSDNNLEGKKEGEESENKNGIDLYLNLKNQIGSKILCDFLLYTRSEIDEIVAKLSNTLNEKNDPNLFTRFTFVSRPNDPSDTDWHKPVKDVIDLIITRREEINNFRGLYAQLTSQIQMMFQSKFGISYNLKLSPTLDKVTERGVIDEELSQKLHKIRMIRNSLMHNDEEFCKTHHQYKIKYTLVKNKKNKQLITSEDYEREIKSSDIIKENLYIYENDIKQFRDEIKELHAEVQRICT